MISTAIVGMILFVADIYLRVVKPAGYQVAAEHLDKAIEALGEGGKKDA